MRLIRSFPLSLRDLGLPDVIRGLAEEDRGIVLRHANNPHDFKLIVQSGGVRSTSMQDVRRAATAAEAEADGEGARRDDEPQAGTG